MEDCGKTLARKTLTRIGQLELGFLVGDLGETNEWVVDLFIYGRDSEILSTVYLSPVLVALMSSMPLNVSNTHLS